MRDRFLRRAIITAILLAATLMPATLLPQEIVPRGTQTGSLPQHFVDHILAQCGSVEAIALDVHNSSTLPRSLTDIRADLEAALQRAGRRMVPADQTPVHVSVTISENESDYVWIADVVNGSVRSTVLDGGPRDRGDLQTSAGPNYSLRKHLLYVSAEPVLDVDEPTSDQSAHVALVLTPESVIQFSQRADGNWQEDKRIEIRRVPVRDLRGRIVSLNNAQMFEIYLPGMKCSGSVIPNLIATCDQSDDPWPLAETADGPKAFFSGTRNFFMGTLSANRAGHNLNPFYGAALLQADPLQLLATSTDGVTRYFEGSDQPHATYAGAGSGAVAITADCGGPAMVLGSGAGDWTKPDTLQLLRPQNERLAPLSARMELDGPLLALWPASATQVHAIIRNLLTGNYEVYTITAACGH